MVEIIPRFYHGNTSSNLPPHERGHLSDELFEKYVDHVKTIEQIDNGDYAIPSGCYGITFLIDHDNDETQIGLESVNESRPTRTPLIIKKENFYNLKKAVREFGENSELYKGMIENGNKYAIKIAEDNYSTPVGYEDFVIVEGEDYHYEVVLHVANPDFGKEPTIRVEDLHAEYERQEKQKNFFKKFFSPN